MSSFLSAWFTPALVSFIVSLWVNRRSEARRARRDNITKLFEVTREDIRRAVEAAIDYFATEPSNRKALQEAKVLLGERELRAAMPVILDSHQELEHESRNEARRRFQDLLAELTGGNFQEAAGEIDREHIRRLAHAGAGLRSALAKMRDAELRILFEADPVIIRGKQWIGKLTLGVGFLFLTADSPFN
ncbi:hypothetical protein ABIC78_001190 [Novosphingobium sp. 1529]|uniref:hypothetical protein n=1 Tax=Novosphingobium sp. 1529 TaxID=3156424 RepID=UPI003393618B